jgi:hypothetical protein
MVQTDPFGRAFLTGPQSECGRGEASGGLFFETSDFGIALLKQPLQVCNLIVTNQTVNLFIGTIVRRIRLRSQTLQWY